MTDEMRAREAAICEVARVNSIGEVSDGFHTFNGLYEQRMILFAALVKAYKDKAWKSYRHEDGEYCFGGGWFIVGIDTPEGSYTYHYENKYWDMFDCVDLPRAKHWDGHTEEDAETRLMSLKPAQPEIIRCRECKFASGDSRICMQFGHSPIGDYINEHYGELQDEAYQRGLEDAWEAARKIIRMPDGDILDLFPDCYASVCTAVQAILKYDASEAIAKLKAYEGNKDEPIKAGDLVERYIDGKLDSKGVYLQEDGGYWRCLFYTGAIFMTFAYPKGQFKKTGKHYDIASILEAMRT